MRQGSKGLWASVFFLIFMMAALPLAASSTSVSAQLCNDNGSQPILQDKDWHLINPSLNYSDYTLQYVDSFVMMQGDSFVMYVRIDTNLTSAVYRGISVDGASWSMGTTPVLQTGPTGSWDSETVFSPDVVWNGTGYMMYYVGDGPTTQSTYPADFRQIGVAFSADGIHWTKYAKNPVITHGPGAYDFRYTRGPAVVFSGGEYRMWYWGTAQLNATVPLQSSIDYATSPDGVHWTKSPSNPVFLGFTYKDNSTSSDTPAVVAVNGTYLMAFSGNAQTIGLATSRDGIRWQFNNQTDLLLSTTGWHNGAVLNPSIVVSGRQLLLWYSGIDNHNGTNPMTPYVAGIGFATCGAVLALPPVTTTTSQTVTTTRTSTSISTSISTVFSTTTQMKTTTVLQNSNASTLEVAIAAVVGASVALFASILVILMRLRSRPAAPK